MCGAASARELLIKGEKQTQSDGQVQEKKRLEKLGINTHTQALGEKRSK